MEPSVKVNSQGQVEDMNILAVWDGVLGHAVEVNICVKVNSRPGTRQYLMLRSDELVEEASVTNIRELKPPGAGIAIHREPEKTDRPSSPSPCSRIPVMQQSAGNWNLRTLEEHQLAKFYRDITNSRSFSAVAAAKRWQEIKEANSSLSPLSCYSSAEDCYAQLDRTDSQHDQPAPLDSLTSISPMHVNSAPASMGCSLESSSISDCSSNLELNACKRRLRVTQGTGRRSRYASELFTYDGMEDLRARIKKNMPLRLGNTSPKTKPVGKPSYGAPIKKPWMPPALSDLSSQSKVTGPPNSGAMPLMPLRSQISETDGPRSRNTLVSSSPGKHISCRQPSKTTNENARTRYKEIKSTEASHMEGKNDCLELANLRTTQNQSGSAEMSIGLGVRDCIDVTCRGCSIGSAFVSPPVSPRRWMRHGDASFQHSKYSTSNSLGNRSAPTWIIEDGDLWIVFPEDARPGTVEIDIKAKIRLSLSIAPYQHSFSIPGLVQLDGTQDPVRIGSFAFFVEREKWIPHAREVRFAFGNVLNWRIKESSHVIGDFRLDTSPKLSIRIKAPVFHVLDFSATVEMSTTVVPATEGEVWLHHRVKIVSEISDLDIFADRVELFLVVRNGLLAGVEYSTEIGTCTVLHESILGPTGRKENEALLKIARDVKDLRADIDLSFTVPYQLNQGATAYPTVRPIFGNVVSETIVLTCPNLPLMLEHVPQVQLSTWETFHYNEPNHAMIRLERLQVPKSFPEELRDGPLIRISELSRVSFKSLESVDDAMMAGDPVYVTRNLVFNLYEISSGETICRIDVDVEVGQNDTLLVIDSQGWCPCYSLIDNQLAMEQRGQWRETKDKYLMLFRADSMKQGDIVHVVFQFQRHIGPGSFEENGGHALPSSLGLNGAIYELPRIVGKTALGPVIRSDLDQCTIHLVDQPGRKEISQTLSRTGLAEMHLPMLTRNYYLSICRRKQAGDDAIPIPDIKPSKSRMRDSSSSDLAFSQNQPDHQGTVRAQFANTESTYEPLVTGTFDTPKEVLTDAPPEATITAGNLTNTEKESPGGLGYLNWVLIGLIALVMYSLYIYPDIDMSTSASSGSDSTGMETGTALPSSLCGNGEYSEGRMLDLGGIPDDSHGEAMAVTDAPSELESHAGDRARMQHGHSKPSVLDMIDRALGWKGR